jgi:aminobenzoyl-glutamate utilization protein B
VGPLAPEVPAGGSTDVADVSWNAPVGVFVWPTLPLGVGLHTWAVTACGGMSIGLKGTTGAATIIAATGYDLVIYAAFREAVRADFLARKGEVKYVPAVAADAAPSELRNVKDGHDEFAPEK